MSNARQEEGNMKTLVTTCAMVCLVALAGCSTFKGITEENTEENEEKPLWAKKRNLLLYRGNSVLPEEPVTEEVAPDATTPDIVIKSDVPKGYKIYRMDLKGKQPDRNIAVSEDKINEFADRMLKRGIVIEPTETVYSTDGKSFFVVQSHLGSSENGMSEFGKKITGYGYSPARFDERKGEWVTVREKPATFGVPTEYEEVEVPDKTKMVFTKVEYDKYIAYLNRKPTELEKKEPMSEVITGRVRDDRKE